MKSFKGTYLIFFLSYLLVVLGAVFLEKQNLIYIKPIPLVILSFLYCKYISRVNILYPVSMLIVIMVNDTLVYIDFTQYFDMIAIVATVYYILNLFLLKKYIRCTDFNVRKFTTIPIVTSLLLIGYLMYTITMLVLPDLSDSLFYLSIMLISMTLFVSSCFFIYISDKYTGGFKLFIAASCCLFVNGILPINELYFYSRVFTILINSVEIMGFFFFMRFLIDNKRIPFNGITKEKYL